MKHLIFFGVFALGLPFGLKSQSCQNLYYSDLDQTMASSSCMHSSNDYLSFYRHQHNHIPDSNTAVKFLDVAIHVWQDQNGEGNWQDTPADRARLTNFINLINNQFFNNNDQPSDPLTGVPHISDTRIRFLLKGIYFHAKGNFHESRSYDAMNEKGIELIPQAANYINIHMSGDTTAGYGLAHTSQTWNFITGQNSPPHHYVWTGYRGDNTGLGSSAFNTNDWAVAQLISHELGHILGLCHTYCCANCTELIDPNTIDFLDDVFNGPPYYHHLYSWDTNVYAPTNTATNNMMGGNKDAGYFSPKQIGRMHRELVLNAGVYRYASGYSASPMEITTSQTWDFRMKQYQDLVVKSGNTLTIQCALEFVPEAKVIIEPGAKLVIDGGRLTKTFYQNHWQGIYVAGNSNSPQTPSSQGVIEVLGGEISYALNGITNSNIDSNGNWIWGTTGGIIHCKDADFFNNRRDVQLLAYTPPYAKNESYDAYFKRCTFLRKKNTYSHSTILPSITMWKVNAVEIVGSSFENRMESGLVYQGGAIHTINASFTVKEAIYFGRKSYFAGYADAIRCQGSSSIAFPIKIIGAEFENNIHSIYLNATMGARVSHNTFKVRTQHNYMPPLGQNFQNAAYGLYLDYSSGVAVEDNEFSNLNNTTNVSAAIVVKDNGGASDQLYHNEIDGFYQGIQAIGNNQNSGDPDYGLNFICNDCGTNTANTKDIVVSNYGKVGNLQGEGSRLPNNRFSSLGSSRHFDNYGLSTITYPYGTGDSRVVPLNYSGLNLLSSSSPSAYSLNCPSVPKSEALPSPLLTELNLVESILSNDRLLLTQLIDQGSTPQLEAQILFASNQLEYQKLYLELMQMAPFVSTENLLNLISIEDYPELALRNILLANPHGIRDGLVWETLLNRSPLLSQQTITDLETGKQSITSRDVLEQQIAAYQVLSERLSGQYLRYYAEHLDSNAFDAIGLIKQHLQNRDELHFKYALIDLHLYLGESQQARQEINAIQQNAILGPQEEMDLQSLQSYYSLISDGNLNELYLEGEALERLQEIDRLGSGYAVGKARALLHLNNQGFSYVEPILNQNGLLLAKGPNAVVRPKLVEHKFSLYPNPAQTEVALQWDPLQGDLANEPIEIQIRSSSGQLIYQHTVSNADSHSHVLDVSHWTKGLYLVEIRQVDRLLNLDKLFVKP